MNKFRKKNDLQIINKIQKARSRNNVYWMNVLRLAVKHSPLQAKKLLRQINFQDQKISRLIKKLAK